jgi:nucleoside-diphosphate-sugar epimerase
MDDLPDEASALVIGAGYLARFLVEQLPGERPILAVRRSAPSAAGAPRVVPLACDVTSGGAAGVLAPALRRFDGPAFFLLPPTGLATPAPAQALATLISVLSAARVRRVVVASSTGIYDRAAGATVSAATPAAPTSPQAVRLAEIERAWRESGLPCSIVRLAGLYGPGRIIGREAILQGRALPGDPAGWLNLVRAEDAAAALVAAAQAPGPDGVYLVSDGAPVRRGDYYSCLAQLLGRAPPHFDPAEARRGASRRCDPSDSWRRLGLQPRHADFRASLRELLARGDHARTR